MGIRNIGVMKRINRLLQFVLSLSLVTSCVESDEAVDLTSMPRQTITIEASQETRRVETRTTLQTDGSVFWNPSDEISLFFNSGTNGGDKFVSQNSENVAIAEFSGSIQGITGGGEDLEENAYFWAVYPYSEGNSCDGSSIVTTLPYKQQAVEGTFADDLFITIARSPSVRMAFKNVCGGVKFCVSKSGIESVIFRGNSGENLAGKVRVSFDENNKPAVTEVIDGQSEVVVTAPNGGTFEPGKYYYIITLPTPLESGFEMIFRKSDNTKIVYKRTSGVVINRSRFGVVENVDSGEAMPDDTPTGGSESGFYLGIIGFNNGLYTYPIKHLSAKSVAGYNSFIDGLSTQNGTLLYYAVDRSVDQLQAATFPSNLYNVSIVTFTDGLDQGSLDEGEGNYLTNAEYLTALNKSLTEEKVSDNSITAYTIGVLGDDASANYNAFRNNLEKLATSSDNVFEVNDMSEVNEAFMEIASQLGETKYYQTFMLEIKGPSHNEKCRFTFDNVSSYDASQCYIEGTFNRVDKTLTDVSYVGLTSTSGTVVSSVKTPDNFYVFTFEGLQTSDEGLVPKDCVQHWYTNEGVWQKNSEFVFDPGSVTMEKIERSAAVLLNLDCSSSLGEEDFATLKQSAKSFITKLRENVADPYTAESISLNKQSVTLSIGMTETLIATVLPDTAVQKDVEWNSTNSTVASVDKNGKITAHELGTTTIIARTLAGGLTATCRVNVSGIYLGITGFNASLYSYPISELNEENKTGFNSFIDSLNMKKGTVLYYAVEQALSQMQSVKLPADLSTAAIVTFTDGLDQGSFMLNGSHGDNDTYLNSINYRIKNDSIGGQPITAYAIGLRGKDIQDEDVTKFTNNLKKLSSSAENATEVTSMAEVNAKFKEIAEQLCPNNTWQRTSEFDKEEDSDIVTERGSAVIMLVLDCSSSLADDFVKAQTNAKDFINTLYNSTQQYTLYSTTPKDLSLAIWKDGTRYYISKD